MFNSSTYEIETKIPTSVTSKSRTKVFTVGPHTKIMEFKAWPRAAMLQAIETFKKLTKESFQIADMESASKKSLETEARKMRNYLNMLSKGKLQIRGKGARGGL